eukprot:scaffold111063_cov20-Tisochrysis_lutea.AAC.1
MAGLCMVYMRVHVCTCWRGREKGRRQVRHEDFWQCQICRLSWHAPDFKQSLIYDDKTASGSLLLRAPQPYLFCSIVVEGTPSSLGPTCLLFLHECRPRGSPSAQTCPGSVQISLPLHEPAALTRCKQMQQKGPPLCLLPFDLLILVRFCQSVGVMLRALFGPECGGSA